MRFIYFRAWRIKTKTMVYFHAADKKSDRYFGPCFRLMQYTRLDDRDGKQIYEGDIVKRETQWFDDNGRDSKDYRFEEIKEPLGNNIFYAGDWTVDNEECRVVGNVFENPEILKGK